MPTEKGLIAQALADDPPALSKGVQPLEAVKFRYIYRALKACGFNRTQTARGLDISVRMLRGYVAQIRDAGYVVEAPVDPEAPAVKAWPPAHRDIHPCAFCRNEVLKYKGHMGNAFCNSECYRSFRARARAETLKKQEARRTCYRTWGARK